MNVWVILERLQYEDAVNIVGIYDTRNGAMAELASCRARSPNNSGYYYELEEHTVVSA